MKSITFFAAWLFIFSISFAQTNVPSKDVQIKSAVMAAQEDMRDGAMIYGYSEKGEFIVLRKGSNDLVCLADDPNQKGFNVACYFKDLDSFMARGRELRKEGKDFKEVFDIRENEVKSGKLKIPQNASLFVLSGSDEVFNTQTGEVTGANLRSVVYIPYATSKTTGLPLKPAAPGMPWLMDPGTHRAHIMITPPSKN
ncbi:MAG: hypothetical protein KF860_12260 [Cyclobacteriaceae bacterium]|nr:hypothetical protein [Cyclobacteriaceae bacterium]